MKTRVIHTKFWHDNVVSQMGHKEKLAFLYFFTNDKVNICGIYELPDKYIKVDLDFTSKELKEVKKSLSEKKRMFFYEGWIIVPNINKYNSYTGSSNEIARLKQLKIVPKKVIKYLKNNHSRVYTSLYGVYTPTRNKKSEIRNKKQVIRNKKSEINEKQRKLINEIRKKHDFLNKD